MNKSIKLTVAATACLAALTSSLFAQLAIPGDGSDGALVIGTNTVIDLSRAVPGVWTNNNTANAGKGIYDSNQWAVVFKYSSVVISNGATLTFLNHPTHAPVVWLVSNAVSGDVTINGALSLDGQPGVNDPVNLTEPGPGGFRGGAIQFGTFGNGSAFGPGGGFANNGFYATTHAYGTTNILPLIGGSGAATYSGNGGGGGGAILIAASGTINVNGPNGIIHANGGMTYGNSFYGSGGAIRLIANQILGTNGTIQATGGDNGRIRLEANTVSSNLFINPQAIVASPSPLTIWPPTNAPSVQVTSISNLNANLNAPADPKAAMSAAGDDLAIATTNALTIYLTTSNFPTTGTVSVYVKPRNASQIFIPQASFVSGNSNSATWQVTNILLQAGTHTVIQARAFVP